MNIGDDTSAINDLEEAVKRDPTNLAYRSNRALILRRRGEYYTAQQDYGSIMVQKELKRRKRQAHAQQKERERETLQACSLGGSREVNQELTKALREEVMTGLPSYAESQRQEVLSNLEEHCDDSIAPLTVVVHGSAAQSSASLHSSQASLNEPSRMGPKGVKRLRGRRGSEQRRDALATSMLTLGRSRVAAPAHLSGMESSSKGFVSAASPEEAFDPTQGQSYHELSETLLGLRQSVTGTSHQLQNIGVGEEAEGSTETAPRDGRLYSETQNLTEPADKAVSVADFQEAQSLMSGSLHEALFCRPSSLQAALLTAPGTRSSTETKDMVPELRSLPAFRDLAAYPAALKLIAQNAEYRVLDRLGVAFFQGEEVPAMAVLLSGSINILMRGGDGNSTLIDTLQPGQTLGEEAMLLETSTAKEGGGDTGRQNHQQRSPSTAPEAASRFYETYQAAEPTELLLIMKEDFRRCQPLVRLAHSRFKRKFTELRRCGLFDDWCVLDVMRLAQLSRIRTYRLGQTMQHQKDESMHLQIMIKGVGVVRKYPDRAAEVQRKLGGIREALDKITTKYAYHRTLKDVQAGLQADAVAEVCLRGAGISGAASDKQAKKLVESMTAAHVTVTELRRWELEKEYRRWERRMHQLQEDNTGVNETEHKVALLHPPCFFGEMAVLKPEQSVALGTIVAESRVETLSIHKCILQTFDVTDQFLAKVKQKSTIFPGDIALGHTIEAGNLWKAQKRQVIEELLEQKRELLVSPLRHKKAEPINKAPTLTRPPWSGNCTAVGA
ncbi:unnamed protein product [Chrysoparadoxa australica]